MEQGTIKTVDAVIPVYRPGKSFEELLKRLSQQEYPLRRVIIMNTEEQYWNTEYETAFWQQERERDQSFRYTTFQKRNLTTGPPETGASACQTPTSASA